MTEERNRRSDQASTTTQDLRNPKPGVIDQRQQQIDPAGKHRVDRNAQSDSNRKQPGGSHPNEPATKDQNPE